MQYHFYFKLYSCQTLEYESKNWLLSLVNTKLDTCKSDVDMCDENIDVKELEQAIKEIGSNKIPGSDSLTLEFF